jgi:bifunctional non-homologous end joining protein LigD
MPDKLSAYHAKRNFRLTPEPAGEIAMPGERLRFVVQKHDARRLHYDFRLEIGGTLKSWAIPKGPSLDPADKRLAVHVEDHPLGYIDFEGDIPERQYGAGRVEVWDIGHWEPQGDPQRDYEAGKLKFRLDGEKLQGGWTLVRTRLGGSGGKEQWLLIKERDGVARSAQEYDITEALPDSVLQDVRSGNSRRHAPHETPARSKPAPAARTRKASPRKEEKRRERIEDVDITHPDRVMDTESGATKLDVARYYQRVAPCLLPFLRKRPVYLLRCPEGIAGEHFFQKHINRLAIAGIRKIDPSLDPGHGPLMAIEDAHALVGAAQMGTVELHACNAAADRIDRPDCMVFDLDPDPGLPWARVAEGARLVKALLDELGLASFLKTSGGKGLHIVVPLSRRHAWDDVTAFSQAVAEQLASTQPELFSAKMGEQNRVRKIFIDYMRNRRHASTVAPYSLRARPGLGVAVPIGWDELDSIGGAAEWTIRTLPARLDTLKSDPWQDYFGTRQNLTAAMKDRLGIRKTRAA